MSIYKIAFSDMQLSGKIPPGDDRWRRFNASFANEELIQPDIAWKIRQGYAFTTWHRNQWRESANYEVGQHLALDFDAGDVTSSLPHLLKDKFVQQYAALADSTPSSQP